MPINYSQWKTKLSTSLKKYIDTYAEKEASDISPYKTSKTYKHCIVIPLYNETDMFFQRMKQSSLSQQATLIIAVINQPDIDDDTSQNQKLWDTLTQQYISLNSSSLHHWLEIPNTLTDVLLINRFTEKIPKKHGVGLARKIGSDIACEFIRTSLIEHHWIHHTDADASLPDNYFSALQETVTVNNSAAVYRYRHQPTGDKRIFNATQRYEDYLNYYVNQLKQAGSPYAFHTIGSCIATNALHYCQSRGFPQRAGGEDFYLLNKLAKLGDVITIGCAEILIDARLSQRVPFGTGPAVEKILAMENPNKEYTYENPLCFQDLAQLLSHIPTLFSYKDLKNYNDINAKYRLWMKPLSQPLQRSLKELKIEQLFIHIEKQINSPEQCIRHCHDWLDGFKTLKLIHLLEQDYPRKLMN